MTPRWFAMLLVFGLASCSSEQTVVGSNVTASVSRDCPAVSPQGGDRVALESTSWSDGKLVVLAKDTFTCGAFQLTKPAYTLAGSELQLSWAWQRPPDAPMAACRCDRRIRFELSGLEKRDYSVRLAR